jgi:hypothetical protein
MDVIRSDYKCKSIQIKSNQDYYLSNLSPKISKHDAIQETINLGFYQMSKNKFGIKNSFLDSQILHGA